MQLVKEGVELSRHYVHMMCTPTRARFVIFRRGFREFFPSFPGHVSRVFFVMFRVFFALCVFLMLSLVLGSFQSGRLPIHVLTQLSSPCDRNGAIPRNMTGIAAQLKAAGYKTHQVCKHAQKQIF